MDQTKKKIVRPTQQNKKPRFQLNFELRFICFIRLPRNDDKTNGSKKMLREKENEKEKKPHGPN